MRRILRLVSLVAGTIVLQACATSPPQDEGNDRIVNRVDVILRPVAGGKDNQPFRRRFEQRNTEGWIGDAGSWSVEALVTHSRLRCGTYEIGLQLGRGNPDCTAVNWLTEVQYGTSERQCNSASMVHAGGGTLPVSREQVAVSSCVRVSTRCTGAC